MDGQLCRVDPDGTAWLHEAGNDGWDPGASVGPGLWPFPRPATDEWTMSVIDTGASRLDHGHALGPLEVPGSRTEPPLLLAPRLGHYAQWSATGESLCYVVPDGRTLSLKVWRPGESAARTLLGAAPVFSTWMPGGDWLVVHHGTTLSAFETITGEQRVLSNSAAGFRAPAVTGDGRSVAWAEVRDDRVELRAGSLEPGDSRLLATFPGGTALSYRPGTSDLTVAVARDPQSGVFSELLRVTAAGAVKRIIAGPIVAYWWSPDGARLASLHPSYTGDGRFQVRIHDPSGRALGATEAFIPSADTATMVGFFDQYATSHPVWSASGRWFGLCGRLVTEGPHPSFSGRVTDRALVWDTLTNGSPHDLGPGRTIAFGRA